MGVLKIELQSGDRQHRYLPALKRLQGFDQVEQRATPAAQFADQDGIDLPGLGQSQVERLEAALNDPVIRDKAAEVLRELIEKVMLLPRASGKGLDAVLHGDLAHILQLCEAANEKSGAR